MHPFSILTLGIFVAGYITARWDLVTRLYELAIFAWDHGVVVCWHSPSRIPRLPDLARGAWCMIGANQLVRAPNRLEPLKASCSSRSFSSSWFFPSIVWLRGKANWYVMVEFVASRARTEVEAN
ncbi:hypothetical protein P168DRAFT_228400 [Aspergillus campestris IBT 28561]|uniref:Uncharacterized protein n=1 Tax=Aspergillus campestris (strain IBT 28561) TaxID=1392248 RepID=A0A2I1DED7_ASPC2|nr:uncharacterized protein P168DRAFT_228400 [Aspergillus campestris IBT 28561]PKY08243.1 hypothetical protein P168DRAFT_228400 [Aspergillus campestris IBT 28561]